MCLFLMQTVIVFAQKEGSLVKSWPISVTPLSIWNSDIAASAGAEYRFHPSFSVRMAADYIYGNSTDFSNRTSGGRLRTELRYYIAGNRLINSRSRVWPYIAIAGGGKYVQTTVSNWYWQNQVGNSFAIWQTYRTINQEWFLMGKTGMQTAFGKEKRFLFDISLALGSSNNDVSYRLPDNRQGEIVRLARRSVFGGSGNFFSGKFTAINFEACFGYRLLH